MKSKYCISKRTLINADVTKVFSLLADIENWNLWTRSVTKISYVAQKQFEVGGKALVIQPKLAPAVWTITEIIDNKSFVWQTKSPGATMTAKHLLENTGQGTCIEHQVIYEGWLAGLFYALTSKLTTLYLDMEISGLKSKCEQVQ